MRRLLLALAGFAALTALAATSTRSQLVAVAGTGVVSGWDVMVEVLANPYFIALPVLPALVVGGVATASSTGSVEVLIRHGSRTRAATVSSVTHVLGAVPFLVVWLLVAVVVAMPFGVADGWGAWTRTPQAQSFSLGEVAASLSPVAAVGAQLLLLVTGAAAVGTALAVLAAWKGRGRLMLWFCAVFVVWAYVSHRVSWPIPTWFRPMTYFTAQNALVSAGSIWAPALVSVLIAGTLLGLSIWGERGPRPRLRVGPAGVYALVAAVVLVGVELLRAPSTAGGEGLRIVFYGFSGQGFDFVAVMLCLLLTVGPGVALQVSFTSRLSHGLYAELIRCRNVAHWWWRVHLRRAVVAAVVVPLAALAVHSVTILALHGPSALAGTRANHVVFFTSMTAGQVLVAAVLLAAVTLTTGRTTAGVWALGAMAVASLPVVFRFAVLPVGLNSLSLLDQNRPVWQPTVVLAGWCLAAVALTLTLTHRRGLQVA